MEIPVNEIILGECREIMSTRIPDESIDTCITSPPYWGLRDFGLPSSIWGGDKECSHEWGVKHQDFDYKGGQSEKFAGQFKSDKTHFQSSSQFCTKCGAWLGQLGLEPHPTMFIDNIVEVCDIIYKKLKPGATFWLNLADTYFNKPKSSADTGLQDYNYGDRDAKTGYKHRGAAYNELKNSDGWLQPKQLLGIPWRVIIALQNRGWILRNCNIWYKRNHMPESVNDRYTKTYEFVFLLAKTGSYYFDLDSIRLPHTSILKEQGRSNWDKPSNYNVKGFGQVATGDLLKKSFSERYHPLGKNPGDVWDIPTRPFYGAHFAVFPQDLIRPIIKAACPSDGIVLDPFMGSGTVAREARIQGKKWIGIELNPKMIQLAYERIKTDNYRPAPDNIKKLDEF